MSNESGWTVFTGNELAAQTVEVQQRVQSALNSPPIAQVVIKLHGLEQGRSEVQVSVSSNGPLKDVQASGTARSTAYAKLLEIVLREVQLGIAELQKH